jgi:uncharacterized membrane protein
MTRYKRQHSGPNLSNGMIWILGICGVAYMVYKIVSCNYAIKSATKYEMKEINSDKTPEIIINDSINKIDPSRK